MNQLPIPLDAAKDILDLRDRRKADSEFKNTKEFTTAALKLSKYLLNPEYADASKLLLGEI